MTSDQQEQHYDPRQPLYPGLNAGRLLDEALWDIASDLPGPNYPEDGELDALAPDLKQLIRKKVDEHQEPQMCRHVEQYLASMSHDVLHSLPAEQRERIVQRMQRKKSTREE